MLQRLRLVKCGRAALTLWSGNTYLFIAKLTQTSAKIFQILGRKCPEDWSYDFPYKAKHRSRARTHLNITGFYRCWLRKNLLRIWSISKNIPLMTLFVSSGKYSGCYSYPALGTPEKLEAVLHVKFNFIKTTSNWLHGLDGQKWVNIPGATRKQKGPCLSKTIWKCFILVLNAIV